MKKLYSLVFLAWLSLQASLAQWQPSYPLGIYAKDVFFTSEQTGFVAGALSGRGVLIRTRDAGASWEKVYTAANAGDLLSVWFTDAATGYALGEGGLLKTADGGTNWNKMTVSLPDGARKLQFTSAQTGYLGTSTGAIHKTVDGGLTWKDTRVPLSGSPYYVDMSFADDQVGYAMGEASVFKTADGGDTWQKLALPGYQYYDLYFVSAQVGFVSSSFGNIYKTVDGGLTWNPISFGSSQTKMHFVDAQRGVFLTDYSQINLTTDGGASSAAHYRSNYTFSWAAVHFPTPDFGCAVGGDGAILTTRNGGRDWLMRNPPTGNARSYRDMHFFPNGEGLAVGEFYGMVRTTNGGDSWFVDEKTLGRDDHYGLHFANADTGMVVLTNNGSALTYDGGKTFFYDDTRRPPFIGHQSSSNYHLMSSKVIFSTGASVGRGGRIAKSVDGGKTWTIDENPPFENYLLDITFPSPDTGYACGVVGKVVKTVDGGNTWQQQDPQLNNDLLKVYFRNPSYGFAIGRQGAIIRTTDGGRRWTQISSGIAFPLVDIHFFSDSVGYVGSSAGQLAKTTNGGLTWKIVTSDEEKLLDVGKYYFKDPNTVFAMGGYGLFRRDLADRAAPPPVTGLSPAENALRAGLKVYPNPAGSTLTVAFPAGFTPRRATVYNHLGQPLNAVVQRSGPASWSVGVAHLPAGVYVLKVEDAQHLVITRKFFKH